jgi:hypothetical protein
MSEASHLVNEPPGPYGLADVSEAASRMTSEDGLDVLDDEVMIEIPPARPSGVIRVKLVHSGRSAPVPADDPWGD